MLTSLFQRSQKGSSYKYNTIFSWPWRIYSNTAKTMQSLIVDTIKLHMGALGEDTYRPPTSPMLLYVYLARGICNELHVMTCEFIQHPRTCNAQNTHARAHNNLTHTDTHQGHHAPQIILYNTPHSHLYTDTYVPTYSHTYSKTGETEKGR